MKTLLLFTFLTVSMLSMTPSKKYAMLCLGDSYTIGESVAENERFPMQTVVLLKKEGYDFDKPIIIAKTGWTTDELMHAIHEWEKNSPNAFDAKGKEPLVTLLIGVNNEFRGQDAEEYRKQFVELLQTAIHYANNKADHVFVLSIPDWGATPFIANDPKHRSAETVGKEIDHFNQISREEALKSRANYIDITPISRKAPSQPDLVAEDGLHPSGKMYGQWSEELAREMRKVLNGGR
jgi:lysophospholipase L1-like esterase